MRNVLMMLNQVFEMQQKADEAQLSATFERNFNKLYNLFEEENLHCINPLGEPYLSTRTDCEASIVGQERPNMRITKVIKPIVYAKENGQMKLLQKGIVIVE